MVSSRSSDRPSTGGGTTTNSSTEECLDSRVRKEFDKVWVVYSLRKTFDLNEVYGIPRSVLCLFTYLFVCLFNLHISYVTTRIYKYLKIIKKRRKTHPGNRH